MARRRPAYFLEPLLLDLIARSPRPSTAYDLIDRLGREGVRVFPNQVFLSLERLLGDGTVHKVELAKAYITPPDRDDALVVCDRCGRISRQPIDGVEARLREVAARSGFSISRTIVECLGCCAMCREPGEGERP